MHREVRLGLALNGGVSLAIWIGGVVDEFLRAASAGKGHPDAAREWVDLCTELDLTVQIDVIVGTSAGGLNGAFLAAGLANDTPDLTALRNLWIENGDFSLLLHPPNSLGIRSLLRGDDFFLPSLQQAVEAVAAAGRGERRLDPPLDVRLTSTDLRGKVVGISDGTTVLRSVDHAVEFRFTDEDFHFSRDATAAQRVARACRSTASFPGAFEASEVTAGLFEARHAPALAVDGSVGASFLVDGGVLNNLPARNAVEAIAAQPAGERVHRFLALVVPDPVVPEVGELVEPLMAQTVTQAAVTIPRNQSLSGFVTEVRRHNNDVSSRRAARSAFLGELGELDAAEAWQRFRATTAMMFPSYRASTHRRSCDHVISGLADRLDPELARVLMALAEDAESSILPWVPDSLDAAPDDSWGSAPVRRLVTLLVTWTNLASRILSDAGADSAARDLLARKRELAQVRDETDQWAPIGGFDAILLEEIARYEAPEETLRNALARWAESNDPQQMHALVARLGDYLRDLVEEVRPYAKPGSSEAARTLSGLIRLRDGAGDSGLSRLLLGFEVIEMAFAAGEPPPDQIIRLAHFTADEAVSMDPSARDDPDEKLAGVQMGHFAAFLKRSWRANDWMWGRLDAGERLVRLLDEASGHQLTESGRLEHHLHAVQTAALREMLPVVAHEIEVDGAAGAYVGEEARRFADAVCEAGTPTDGGSPVGLDHVDDRELSALLDLNRVGVERLASEAGMPRASTLMFNAATTMSGLLRTQVPDGLRSVTGLVSRATSLALRWRRMAAWRRGLIVGTVWTLTVAAIVVLVMGRMGHSQLWLTVLAWVVVAVSIALGGAHLAIITMARRTRRRRALARQQAGQKSGSGVARTEGRTSR